MGKTVTPTYRLEFSAVGSQGLHRVKQAWDVKAYGMPSIEALKAYKASFLASCEPGGVNAHLGSQNIGSMNIVRQRTGELVARLQAPMFEVIP